MVRAHSGTFGPPSEVSEVRSDWVVSASNRLTSHSVGGTVLGRSTVAFCRSGSSGIFGGKIGEAGGIWYALRLDLSLSFGFKSTSRAECLGISPIFGGLGFRQVHPSCHKFACCSVAMWPCCFPAVVAASGTAECHLSTKSRSTMGP